MLQQIAVAPVPNQTFNLSLLVGASVVPLGFDLCYNEMAGCWYINIYDNNGNLLLGSIPLVTGTFPAANILCQYGYLAIGSSYVVNMGNTHIEQLRAETVQDIPNATDLGTDFLWLWGDQP